MPGGHYPAVPSNAINYGPNFILEAWSKGYVEFLWNPHLRTLTPWLSSDGMQWHHGTNLDLGAWKADFAIWDEPAEGDQSDQPDPNEHDGCTVDLDDFEEGPSSLLVRANFECSGGCGGPFLSSDAMWVSPDGANWTATSEGPVSSAGAISGGDTGFVALASSNSAWVSTDGHTWSQYSLPAGAVDFADPVAIAGGFVLAGAVVIRKGYGHAGSGPNGGCVGYGPEDTTKYEGAVWWSPDGTTWTRDTLTGTTAFGIMMNVIRVDGQTVIADEQSYRSDGSLYSEIQWGSHDGKSWTRLTGAPFQTWLTTPSQTSGSGSILYCRTRGLSIDRPSDDATAVRLFRIDSNFRRIALTQSGDQPWYDEADTVLGPAGLLAVNADGNRFWIGVPSGS